METPSLLGDIVQLSPRDLEFSLAGAGDETCGILDGDWDLKRVPFASTKKHRSIEERYVNGKPWEETALFGIYKRRFDRGSRVRGTDTIEELARQYYSRVDGLFNHLKEFGFCLSVNGRKVPLPNIHIGHDGEPLLGNNGNHRVSMAKILELPRIFVKVQSQHVQAKWIKKGNRIMTMPALPDGADKIPAMTTEMERLAYYRLALERAPYGAVVEMGAWLGASTVYIAAGVRDSGCDKPVHVYDRFVWNPSHDRKASDWEKQHGSGYRGGAVVGGTQYENFNRNLAELSAFVQPHQGEIKNIEWNHGPVSLMVLDAPKRVREISGVLTKFAKAIQVGTVLAWQDFAHFPSYEIVACLSRLSKYLEFREAIYPGTTAVFNVIRQWEPQAVSEGTLALNRWSPSEIKETWDAWLRKLPEEMRARFRCGAAMFLCDIGATTDAAKLLRVVKEDKPDEIIPKWRYLRENRHDMITRYKPLFEQLAD